MLALRWAGRVEGSRGNPLFCGPSLIVRKTLPSRLCLVKNELLHCLCKHWSCPQIPAVWVGCSEHHNPVGTIVCSCPYRMGGIFASRLSQMKRVRKGEIIMCSQCRSGRRRFFMTWNSFISWETGHQFLLLRQEVSRFKNILGLTIFCNGIGSRLVSLQDDVV